jgi:hypothetical protein
VHTEKIYENATFSRFLRFSVEIIEDFFKQKVIHSLFALTLSAQHWYPDGIAGFRLSKSIIENILKARKTCDLGAAKWHKQKH